MCALIVLLATLAQVAPPEPLAPLPTREQLDWHAAAIDDYLADAIRGSEERSRRAFATPADLVGETHWNFVEGGEDWAPAVRVATVPRSLDELERVYYDTVGRGANLRLEPDSAAGSLAEAGVATLARFLTQLDATYDDDLLEGATARASNVRGRDARYGPGRALDADPATYWATDDGTEVAFLDLDLGGAKWLDRVRLEEPIALGQRVRAFRVEARVGGAWRVLARGGTIGARRLLRVEPVEATHLRIVIESARACPLLARVGAYLSPPRVSIETPEDVFLGSTLVTLTTDLPAASIRYTLDGTVPTVDASLYERPFFVDRSVELVARAFFSDEPGVLVARKRLRGYTPETLREPIHTLVPPAPGWRVRAYVGEFTSFDELADVEAGAEAIVGEVDLVPRTSGRAGALVFEGLVRAGEAGLYTFLLTSDGPSRLSIGAEVLVEKGRRAGTVGLKPGWHPVRLEVLHGADARELELAWRGPKLARQPIAADAAAHL